MKKNDIWSVAMFIVVIGCLPRLSSAIYSDPGGVNALPSLMAQAAMPGTSPTPGVDTTTGSSTTPESTVPGTTTPEATTPDTTTPETTTPGTTTVPETLTPGSGTDMGTGEGTEGTGPTEGTSPAGGAGIGSSQGTGSGMGTGGMGAPGE